MTTSQVAIAAAIRSAYATHCLDSWSLAELSLTVLTEDRRCVTLLNSLFKLLKLKRYELLELSVILTPAFNRQVTIDEIRPALIVLLADSSGVPESVIISFLNRLRKADPSVSPDYRHDS